MNRKIFYRVFICFICICTYANCTDNKLAGVEYTILNQNFISIVDTIAYDYNSLRPAPNAEFLKRETQSTLSPYMKNS